jgi:hypothetical protein
MLDASEGSFRLDEVSLRRFLVNLGWLPDDLVWFKRGDGRASASPLRITMFETELADPVAAGKWFHHEWGHARYFLPDEYIDVYQPPPDANDLTAGVIDPNSLMGTTASFEFCGPRNHVWAPGLDIPGPDMSEESSWSLIASRYDVAPNRVNLSDYHQGRYLDVLHALDNLLKFTIY